MLDWSAAALGTLSRRGSRRSRAYGSARRHASRGLRHPAPRSGPILGPFLSGRTWRPSAHRCARGYAFDLIWLEAQDLRGGELIGRRRMLHKALKEAGPALRFSEHLAGVNGEAMFRHACALELEGIGSKRVTSPYKSGSCLNWVKVKNHSYERR